MSFAIESAVQDIKNEVYRLQDRAETAEAEAEQLRADMEEMTPAADAIRQWAERRRVLGLSLDVEELARDVEEKVWEFRK